MATELLAFLAAEFQQHLAQRQPCWMVKTRHRYEIAVATAHAWCMFHSDKARCNRWHKDGETQFDYADPQLFERLANYMVLGE